MGPITSYTFDVNRTGQYVRLQLTGTNYLHPREVRIWSPSRMTGALARPSIPSIAAAQPPKPFDFAGASRRARGAQRVALR